MPIAPRLRFIIFCTIISSALAFGWGGTGHRIINQKAPIHLPPMMASWKADSLFFAAHASDADNRKIPSDTSFWAEGPRHFIDIDWYPNWQHIPHSLDSMIMLYGRSTVRTQGTQPWNEVKELDSLTAQFARGDFVKAETTMADLGHYVADAHQPLHCTANYDGQLSGNSGIHSRYETQMVNTFQSALTIFPDSARYIADPLDYVFDFIYHSNSYTDSIMAADDYAKSVSGWNGSGTPPSAYYTALWQVVGGFTKDQFQRATVALASLWYTAWVNSQVPPPVHHTISAQAAGGSIVPSGSVQINDGRDTSFAFSPNPGYHFDSLMVDGVRQDSVSTFTFHGVSIDHTISAMFSINTYQITCSTHGGGATLPAGPAMVNDGSDQRFAFQPQTGYHADSAKADGSPVDSLGGYTFRTVMGPHTLEVWFSINRYTLTASSGSNGSIIPSGTFTFDYGSSERFTVQPDSGFRVDAITVDGVKVDSTDGYTFPDISGSHTVTVTFRDFTDVLSFHLSAGWNIVSIPINAQERRKVMLFPAVISPAFGYQDAYVAQDSLSYGPGYWIKCGDTGTVSCRGVLLGLDSIPVRQGWNLIGSISKSIAVSQIGSEPAGIVVSRVFGYDKGYAAADSIVPGKGYWVKVNQSGSIILSSTSPLRNRISVQNLRSELPPAPPSSGGDAPSTVLTDIPGGFHSASYPNPFNPATRISFLLAEPQFVTVKIFDVLGKEVTTLMSEKRGVGETTLEWSAGAMPSGVYYYRITAGEGPGSWTETRKIILLR